MKKSHLLIVLIATVLLTLFLAKHVHANTNDPAYLVRPIPANGYGQIVSLGASPVISNVMFYGAARKIEVYNASATNDVYVQWNVGPETFSNAVANRIAVPVAAGRSIAISSGRSGINNIYLGKLAGAGVANVYVVVTE